MNKYGYHPKKFYLQKQFKDQDLVQELQFNDAW